MTEATAIDFTAIDDDELTKRARDDHAAAKTARRDGKAIPPTPYLDELTRRTANKMSTTATAKKAGGSSRTKNNADVRYFHDGQPMSDRQNKLSSVAWFYTKGIDPKEERLGVDGLVAELKKLKVDDPRAPGWMAKLPNGITIEARKQGEASKFTGTPARPQRSTTKKATKTKATKSTAKKSTAKKATHATKRAAKARANGSTSPKKKATPKASTKKAPQVTPIPKKATAKKATTSPGPKSLAALLP